MKHQVQFKDPDLIFEIITAKHPMPADPDDDSHNSELAREVYGEEYFEYGDYGRFEIDIKTLSCRAENGKADQ